MAEHEELGLAGGTLDVGHWGSLELGPAVRINAGHFGLHKQLFYVGLTLQIYRVTEHNRSAQILNTGLNQTWKSGQRNNQNPKSNPPLDQEQQGQRFCVQIQSVQIYWQMQHTDRVLVNVFKEFFDKTCLSLVKEHYPVLKEWLYFSSILSQQFIDFQRLERYVQNLNPIITSNLADTTKPSTLSPFKQSDPLGTTFKRRKPDNKDRLGLGGPPSYGSSITIGEPIFNLRGYGATEISRTREEVVGSLKDTFKLTDAQITKPMVSKLNCLHMTFLDNHHKLQFPKKEAETPRRYSDMHELFSKVRA